MTQGISIREFARRDGCHESLVRRAVKAQHLKALADGTLDPALVGSGWRSSNRRKVVRASAIRVTAESRALDYLVVPGLSREVAGLIAAIRGRWPSLMQRALRLLGADERAVALANFAMQELMEHHFLALTGDDLSLDVSDIMPPAPALEWGPAEAELLDRLATADPAWFDSAEGQKLVSEMLEVGTISAGV